MLGPDHTETSLALDERVHLRGVPAQTGTFLGLTETGAALVRWDHDPLDHPAAVVPSPTDLTPIPGGTT